MSTSAEALAGQLILTPGSSEPIVCRRPVVGATLMRRLTEGRHATLLPELLGSVFTLCAGAHRSTARRAIAAALGRPVDTGAVRDTDALALAMATAREHLQRLAIDLPRLPSSDSTEPDPIWLRDAPVLALPARADAAALREAAAALPSWLERRLFGLPPADWLSCWRGHPAAWLADWSAGRAHPLARWLQAVRPRVEGLALPCRPLALLEEGDAGLRAIAQAVAADPAFPERPVWHGVPAETGPWTRLGRAEPVGAQLGVWQRLGSRLADLAALACGETLAFGALALAPGEAIAYTEMSRGLLLHWVRLEGSTPDTARAADYRVFAPTEWNFHPQGSLAQALREARFNAEETRLAAWALDPCIRFEIGEVHHA